MALANLGLLLILQRIIFKSIAVQPVDSFVCAGAVVAPEQEQFAIVDHARVPPPLGWMVRLLGLQHPLQLFKLPTFSACLHTSFFKFLLTPIVSRSHLLAQNLPSPSFLAFTYKAPLYKSSSPHIFLAGWRLFMLTTGPWYLRSTPTA